jgi:folate-binding protein YgfZ
MAQGLLLGELTILSIAGADRVKIANNLATQDLKSLSTGQVAETFITDVKGRTLSHGVVVAREDSLWFISSPGQGPRLATHVDRYIIREDVAVQDVSCQWDAVLFFSMDDAAAFATAPSGGPVFVVSVPWVVGGGLVFIPAGELSRINQPDTDFVIATSDTSMRVGWERARIEAFWPWYGVDLDDRNLPQEAGVDARAISFKKGCYLGQETVARLDALGQVQKRLVKLAFAKMPNVELPFSIEADGKEIGTLTSLAATQSGGGIGLAMIRRSHFRSGTQFAVAESVAEVL